jgi:chaperonin GroEL
MELLNLENLNMTSVLANAGISYGPYFKEGWGINVITGEGCNLIKEGIIDPLLVTKSALRNAASVATTILSTDCIINNLRINESNR